MVINSLGKYHGLYVQSNTLLLAEVFANFHKMFLEIFELDPAFFLTAQGLPWQATLRKHQGKIRSFNWYWYVVNGRKGIRGGICYANIQRSSQQQVHEKLW